MPDNVCIVCGRVDFTALDPIKNWVCDECYQEYATNDNDTEWDFSAAKAGKPLKKIEEVAVMPSYEEIYGGDFLVAKDLKGIVEAEISAIELQELGDKTKLIASLKGMPKKLVLNKTNAKRVSEIANTTDYTKWVGAKIKLYKIVTTFAKDEVEAIRVKPLDSPDNKGDV